MNSKSDQTHNKDSNSHYDKYIVCKLLGLFLLFLFLLLLILVINCLNLKEYMTSLPVLIFVGDLRILLVYKLSRFPLKSRNFHIVSVEFFSSGFPYVLQIFIHISQLIHLGFKFFYLHKVFLIVIFLSLVFKVLDGSRLVDTATSSLSNVVKVLLKEITHCLVTVSILVCRLNIQSIYIGTLIHIKQNTPVRILCAKSLTLAILYIRERGSVSSHIEISLKQMIPACTCHMGFSRISISTLRLSGRIIIPA